MNYNYYSPEGTLWRSHENTSYISSISGLERAMREGKILEGIAFLCDEELNLHVDLCGLKGIIPREECVFVNEGEQIKDIAIITRVGKPVCFKVRSIEPDGDTYRVMLSRRDAQVECRSYYLSSLVAGDIIPAAITHLDTFGAFLDIGCGVSSLLSIDCISVSRISHPADRLYNGQRLHVVVKFNDLESGRIYVSLKELLGTWEENARSLSAGQTVSGIVRSVESYGIFVELAPNLAGLAEHRTDNPALSSIKTGECVSVYIKSIIPEKMKIKLILIDASETANERAPISYFTDVSSVTHINRWVYSPSKCPKVIETIFE